MTGREGETPGGGGDPSPSVMARPRGSGAPPTRGRTPRRARAATRPNSSLSFLFMNNVSSAVASSPGLRGLTRKPVRPSSTISGTAAARHATTGNPAAIASANTSPNPSWTVGRQKQWALTYSTASVWRVTSPSRTAASPSRSSRWSARRLADSGPLSYDANLSVGDSLAEHRRGPQQIVQALARVHPRDRQHGRSGGPGAGRLGEAAPPVDEIDRLGNDHQLRSRNVVHVVSDRRRVRLGTTTRSARAVLDRSQRACSVSSMRTQPRSFRSSSAMMPFSITTKGPRRRRAHRNPSRSTPTVTSAAGGARATRAL